MAVHISIVSPVYRGEKLLPQLVSRITEEVSTLTDSFEIILVNDKSPDDSWRVMQALAKEHPKLKVVNLSRNFGQQYALAAGLSLAKGEWVATMDCDLQDDPKELVRMYQHAIANKLDGVLASRSNRQDDWLKKTGSKWFYKILSYLANSKFDPSIANFYICKRKVFEAIDSMGDYYRYLPVMIHWVGFNIESLAIDHQERTDGVKSSYSFRRRISLAWETIISFSEKPLKLMVTAGFILAATAFIIGFMMVLLYFTGNYRVPGWASLILALSVYSGIIIATLGLVGVYVGKTFQTVKNRPNFIIDEVISQTNDSILQ